MQSGTTLNTARLAYELKQAASARTLVIEGPPADRTRLVFTIASQLGYRVYRTAVSTLTPAEQNSVILFFDEADSLFAKRTTVQDSHDRYANSLDSFTGLTIYGVAHASDLPPTILKRARVVSTPPH